MGYCSKGNDGVLRVERELHSQLIPTPNGHLRLLVERLAADLKRQQDPSSVVCFVGHEVCERREDTLLEPSTFGLDVQCAHQLCLDALRRSLERLIELGFSGHDFRLKDGESF